VQIVWLASVQQSGMELPSPHSQHPLARMYGLHAPAAQTWFVAHAVPQAPQCVASV
jgi:hypothetical protein